MFERYTERARRTLFFARYEATRLGSASIETEHMLLGLIREGENKSLPGRIFAHAKLSPQGLRQDIERRVVLREKVSSAVEIPFSAEVKRLLQFAAEEAGRLKHPYIGPEHLLLGILRDEGSLAASILAENGIRIDAVRTEVASLSSGDQPAETPALPGRHVQIVLQLYEAFRRGDVSGIVALLSPDVEWSEPENPFNPAAGTRRGEAGFLEWLRVGHEAEEILVLEPRQILSNPDSVAVVGHSKCLAKPTGRTYDTDFVHVVTFRDGKIVRFQEFFDTFAAAEAFRPA